jgi:hypothetical protein
MKKCGVRRAAYVKKAAERRIENVRWQTYMGTEITLKWGRNF